MLLSKNAHPMRKLFVASKYAQLFLEILPSEVFLILYECSVQQSDKKNLINDLLNLLNQFTTKNSTSLTISQLSALENLKICLKAFDELSNAGEDLQMHSKTILAIKNCEYFNSKTLDLILSEIL